MTDARFPERWLNDRRVMCLPDDAFRLFVISVAWSVANRTDGRIYDDELALMPASSRGSGELAKHGCGYGSLTTGRSPSSRRRKPPKKTLSTWTCNGGKHGTGNEQNGHAKTAASRVTSRVTYIVTALGQDRHLGQQPPTTGECAASDCTAPARRGCLTCWDHSYLEATL